MTKRKNHIFLAVIISILVIIALFTIISNSLPYNQVDTVCYLNDQWNVTYNGDKYYNLTFEEIQEIPTTKYIKGDIVTLSTTLPQIDNFDFPSICFASNYCALNITLTNLTDGTEHNIYSYETDNFENNQFIGCNYQIINLPSDYTNYEITITIFCNTTSDVLPIELPIFSSYHNLIISFVNSHFYAICSGIASVIFGISFLFISLMFIGLSKTSKVQILSGLLCIDIGIWILNYYNITNLFFDSHNHHMTLVSYIAMFLIVPLAYMIIDEIHHAKNKLIFTFVSFLNVFIPIELLAFHFLKHIYLNETRVIYFLTAFVTFIFLTIYLISDIKNIYKDKRIKSASNRLQLYGIFAIGCSGIIEILLRTIKFIPSDLAESLRNFILPSGVMIYVITIILNYLIYSTEGLARAQQYEKLTELAYADSLTKLPNRAVSDYLSNKFATLNSNYCIVSIDINGLKEVNDTYGHVEGDKLITDFAKCLSKYFEDIGTCARIGGDEFIIYIEEIDVNVLKKRLDLMTLNFKSLDTRNSFGYTHSFAYGYAFKNSLENSTPHTVYMTADQLMYDMKRKQHGQKK